MWPCYTFTRLCSVQLSNTQSRFVSFTFLCLALEKKISADKLLKMEGNDPSKNIKDWLTKMGDPNWDPWPKNCFGKEILDDENGIKIDPTIHDENYKYRGHRDEDGEPHAFGEITYENGDIVQSEFKHGENFNWGASINYDHKRHP